MRGQKGLRLGRVRILRYCGAAALNRSAPQAAGGRKGREGVGEGRLGIVLEAGRARGQEGVGGIRLGVWREVGGENL